MMDIYAFSIHTISILHDNAEFPFLGSVDLLEFHNIWMIQLL